MLVQGEKNVKAEQDSSPFPPSSSPLREPSPVTPYSTPLSSLHPTPPTHAASTSVVANEGKGGEEGEEEKAVEEERQAEEERWREVTFGESVSVMSELCTSNIEYSTNLPAMEECVSSELELDGVATDETSLQIETQEEEPDNSSPHHHLAKGSKEECIEGVGQGNKDTSGSGETATSIEPSALEKDSDLSELNSRMAEVTLLPSATDGTRETKVATSAGDTECIDTAEGRASATETMTSPLQGSDDAKTTSIENDAPGTATGETHTGGSEGAEGSTLDSRSGEYHTSLRVIELSLKHRKSSSQTALSEVEAYGSQEDIPAITVINENLLSPQNMGEEDPEMSKRWYITFEQFISAIQLEPELCQFFAEQDTIDLESSSVDPILSRYTQSVLTYR